MLALPLFLALLGCDTAPPEPTTPDPLAAASLQASIELLSSDAYLGRGTGEEGADKAAAWIEDQFKELGLTPLPGHDGLQLPYTLFTRGLDKGSSSLALAVGETPVPADLGQTWRAFPFSDAGALSGDVVFAGYGIQNEDLGWDDYKDLDVAGKWVLVLRHDPGEGEDESAWKEHPNHALFTTKAQVAYEQGARGMLLVSDPLHHEEADDLRADGPLRLEKPKPRPERPARPGQEETEPFLALQIDQPTATALVAPSGKDLKALQTALNAGEAVNGALQGVTADATLTEQEDWVAIEPTNVVGFLEGSDPELKDEWVVIGGHYDHLGAFHGDGDTVFNGADDNASGTAGVVHLAKAFAAGERPKRSIAFALFSGEEKGLLGSRALVRDKVLDPDKIVFMLNLDMIGRDDTGEFEVVGDGFSAGIQEAVEAANADVGLELSFGGTDYAGNSDHHPFYQADVPFLFFFTGLHEDYHQLSDHADKLNYEQVSNIAKLGHGLVSQVAGGEVTPRFVHHVSWLGIAVEVQEVEGRMRPVITSVEADSRATEAGLAQGDLIVGFDDAPLEDPHAVGASFRDLEPGSETRLTVDRPDLRTTVKVVRAKTGYLGVYPGSPTEEFRKEHGLGDAEGVLLRQVMEGTPAAAAGLQTEDTLIRINGVPVGLGSLSKVLTRIGAGETVPVVVIRDGERQEMTMTLGERPERP